MTAGWVTYQVSGALEMLPTLNLRWDRPLATEAAMPSLPVALSTFTVKDPRAGAGTTVGWQAAFGGAGVSQPREYAVETVPVPSRTPGNVTNTRICRTRCLRQRCSGVRSCSVMWAPLVMPWCCLQFSTSVTSVTYDTGP